MSEFDLFVSSLNDDTTRATDVMIVGKRSSECPRDSGGRMLFAECVPFLRPAGVI